MNLIQKSIASIFVIMVANSPAIAREQKKPADKIKLSDLGVQLSTTSVPPREVRPVAKPLPLGAQVTPSGGVKIPISGNYGAEISKPANMQQGEKGVVVSGTLTTK